MDLGLGVYDAPGAGEGMEGKGFGPVVNSDPTALEKKDESEDEDEEEDEDDEEDDTDSSSSDSSENEDDHTKPVA